tara:strand:+ start:909 stop:1973 length:1065 start_codon:yes stop_codon:yes gene_type:complete
MKVCIVGNGLIGLVLAKALVNQGIYVDIFLSKNTNKINKSRTLGISAANTEYFNEYILNIKNLLWEINKIEIYSDKLKNEKILNFENNGKKLFSIIKNYQLYDYLNLELNKNPFFKIKKNISKLIINKYKLIINCDANSFFFKKYFYKKFNKNYKSHAHTSIIDHKKLSNNCATQIFTKDGPIAFLPISKTKTSVVYSARGKKDIDLKSIIKKYNSKYFILKINKISSFELRSLDLRTYYFQNILAFGDLLHKIHPLAGQGFNMSIRDIKLLVDLIKVRLNNGLELDNSICIDFEKKIKHKNYIFSTGIDFIYEFFNFESRIKNSILSKSVKFFGKNIYANKIITRLADNGIVI